MQISLIDYLDSPEFATFLQESNIDALIVEDETICSQVDLPRHILSDKKQLGLQGVVLSVCQEYERPLLLVRELPVSSFFPVLSEPHLTIINIGVGLSSIMVQQWIENNDVVSLRSQKEHIYEPYDIESFHHSIISGGYIRLSHYDVPLSLFAKQKDMEDVMDLTSHQMAGDKATILVAGSLITTRASAMKILQEEGVFCDVFLLANYHMTMSEALKDSLRQTEHLILIVDLEPTSLWFDYVKSQLFEVGLFETQVSVITPDYDKLTTINPEYIADKANFGLENLVERVKGVL